MYHICLVRIYSAAVSANIKFENGECLEGLMLEGGESYSSSMKELEEQHKSRVCSVVFNDSQNEEDEGSGEGEDTFTPFSSTYSPEEEEEEDRNTGGGRGLRAYASSPWDSVPTVNNQQTTNPLLKEMNLATVLQRYENLMPIMAMERASIAEVKESMRHNSSSRGGHLNYPSTAASRPSSESIMSPAADQEIEKHQAIQVIQCIN